MRTSSCHIHITPGPEQVVHLSGSLMRSLKLAGKKRVRVKLGQTRVNALLRPLSREGRHLCVSNGLRTQLAMPRMVRTAALVQADENELQLGPLVGILTDFNPARTIGPLGGRSYMKHLMRLGEKRGYFFAFTPRDVNWSTGKVNGYFLNRVGGWTRQLVPLPDVVYNRLPNRRAEIGQTLVALREKFVKLRIPIFNWSFFNKSDVYQLLDDEPEARKHLPETVNQARPDKLKEMLQKHDFVYYKPAGGSLGYGIYRLAYQEGRGYYARYRQNGANVLLKFATFSGLMRLLSRRHGAAALSNYVAQQGIKLIEIDGCPIDFRFHMHKNGANVWTPVGIGAKKAGRGSVTTHLKNGGELLTPEQALGATFGAERGASVLDRAKRVSVRLCEAIERNYPHQLGELGLDIGIDQDGDIWMFEANAKPGRSIFAHPSLREQGVSSLTHIVDHCLYLAQMRGQT